MAKLRVYVNELGFLIKYKQGLDIVLSKKRNRKSIFSIG
jgi:hypothetical protein